MRETTALRNASKRDEFEQPGAACPVDDVHQHVELGDRPGRRLLVQEGGTLERLKEAAYRATRPAAVSASARSSSSSTDAASSVERMAARSSRLGMMRSSMPIAGMNMRSRSLENGGTGRAKSEPRHACYHPPLQIERLV